MEKFINVKGFPLVFVQNAAGDSFTVYQDGKEVRGIRSIRIDAGVDEFTTHEIEYVTGATAEEKWEGNGGKSGWIFEDSPQKSANERRKEAIEKAKKFVEEITAITGNGYVVERSQRGFKLAAHVTEPEFIVNEEKRTVVALGRGLMNRRVLYKGTAKCAPSVVFNVHIGKAIALGRAYGLDVSEFEQAPQPDEVVPGMDVRNTKDYQKAAVGPIYSGEIFTVVSEKSPSKNECQLGSDISKNCVIISDSEAQY